MKFSHLFFTLFLFGTIAQAQDLGNELSVHVTVDKKLKKQFVNEGRMYLFLTTQLEGEPYKKTFPMPWNLSAIFARNIKDVDGKKGIELKATDDWTSTVEWSLAKVPAAEYNVQVFWDQDVTESRIEAPGNLYSIAQTVTINKTTHLDFELTEVIAPRTVVKHELSREINYESAALSEFWDKPMFVKASILLPHDYDSTKTYPIRYNVAGYGGRYTRINYSLEDSAFMSWWTSAEAPEIITVFLDGEGPYGDCYQMDSHNSGPYGTSLVEELIPYIEGKYRGTTTAKNRFVDGCSTGGWVSLGLQLFYPDVFDGCFSYSPDAVEFTNYQLVNIYRDRNVFVNEFGNERPVMRMTDGEPILMMKKFVEYENVLGTSNTYVTSGGQFSAHTALYSPQGEDGLPAPMFDPITGDIDQQVVNYWTDFDFKKRLEANWTELGPKLAGKIYVWMGDMDHFYLNQATRELSDYFDGTSAPKSDAVVEFSAGDGHCQVYSHKRVLIQCQERVDGGE